jgi:arylsulfatase A-like enzyme
MITPVKNVLLFIADQWRGDTLGVLGHDCVQTPHLDALAADGMVFANHSLYAPEPYDTMHHPQEVPLPTRPATREHIASQHPWIEWELTAQAERLAEYFPHLRSFHAVTEQDDRRMRGAYYGNCSEVDAQFGRLVDYLKAIGLYDETLIIFCSDHAEQLGDNWLYGRRGPYDGNFHVPCIIRDPRPTADRTRGQIVESFTEHIDLMPTILEALALQTPEQCEGRSLLPFLNGKAPPNWRNAVHFAYDFRDLLSGRVESALGLTSAECHFMAIRDERYKYVHFPTLPPLFFDLEADPHECNNRADDPAYARQVSTYAQKLLSWRMSHERRGLSMMMQSYGAPLHDYASKP